MCKLSTPKNPSTSILEQKLGHYLILCSFFFIIFRLVSNFGNQSLAYRVFKYQVCFLKVVQLGALWTNLHKLFFSDFLKVYIFCQVTKKKAFYCITAAAIAKCSIEILHFIEKRGHFVKNATFLFNILLLLTMLYCRNPSF